MRRQKTGKDGETRKRAERTLKRVGVPRRGALVAAGRKLLVGPLLGIPVGNFQAPRSQAESKHGGLLCGRGSAIELIWGAVELGHGRFPLLQLQMVLFPQRGLKQAEDMGTVRDPSMKKLVSCMATAGPKATEDQQKGEPERLLRLVSDQFPNPMCMISH